MEKSSSLFASMMRALPVSFNLWIQKEEIVLYEKIGSFLLKTIQKSALMMRPLLLLSNRWVLTNKIERRISLVCKVRLKRKRFRICPYWWWGCECFIRTKEEISWYEKIGSNLERVLQFFTLVMRALLLSSNLWVLSYCYQAKNIYSLALWC